MDNAGWHAQRRAQRESARYYGPHRGPDGRYQPVAHVMPMNDGFVGGLKEYNALSPPPIPPPKDYVVRDAQSDESGQTRLASQPRLSTTTLTHRSAIERSRLLRVARMEPHLQFMVGPLLRYDTVDTLGVWSGFALIVTSDAGSIYDPHPMLTYQWDPDAPVKLRPLPQQNGSPFDLGPHPADPNASALPSPTDSHKNGLSGPNAQIQHVPGHEIWVYGAAEGTFTFWRFSIQIPLGPHEMLIKYSINNGQELNFYVPGQGQNMRWAAHSCNGFSSGVNPDDFCGPGFKSGFDPVWADLLAKHADEPFHALIGGGDQLYCDSLMREPEMQEWVHTKSDQKFAQPLTEEISSAIDRFYFNHYCQCFRSGAFARANSSIPMMNMADDHDLIDGFGSYPDNLQLSPIFNAVGSRGYFFFLLFQCFINVDADGTDDRPGKHSNKSLIIGGNGPYVPFPSHSFLAYLGPQTWILLLDCRAERKKDQICSPQEYEKVFQRLQHLPSNVEHLVVQIGVPIAYPRMVFLESALDSKFNPLVLLGKSGRLGLSGFVNKFNAQAELLDDLNDHWTAKAHKKERNWFIEQLQHLAKGRRIRVSFLSGDVHCAAVGVLKTLAKGKNEAIPVEADYRYMVNVVTSAIVNTPPPNGVLTMVNSLASKTHKTMHYAETDESMIPLFSKDTDGSPRKQKYIMGRRNWCSVNWDHATGDLLFDIRVEKEKGIGQTVGYSVRTPPPRWAVE